MKKKAVIAGLVFVMVFQASVLMGEFLGAVYPLWTGKEVRLKIVPYDPRSMFRGNYVRLRYDISNIETKELNTERIRNGEVVYVRLKPGADGVYEFDGASLEKPGNGVFIRGRAKGFSGRKRINMTYGIEALFAPKEKALELEKNLRKGGLAIVMIAGNGKATLKDVVRKE